VWLGVLSCLSTWHLVMGGGTRFTVNPSGGVSFSLVSGCGLVIGREKCMAAVAGDGLG